MTSVILRSQDRHTSSIPIDLQELLIKLEFISLIQEGTKLNTNNMSFVSADSWIGAFKRAYYQENRETTIQYINNVINSTISAINCYNESDYLRNIINSLNGAKIGIEKFQSTYRDDPKLRSKLNVCLSNIGIQLEKYKHLIKGCEDMSA